MTSIPPFFLSLSFGLSPLFSSSSCMLRGAGEEEGALVLPLGGGVHGPHHRPAAAAMGAIPSHRVVGERARPTLDTAPPATAARPAAKQSERGRPQALGRASSRTAAARPTGRGHAGRCRESCRQQAAGARARGPPPQRV